MGGGGASVFRPKPPTHTRPANPTHLSPHTGSYDEDAVASQLESLIASAPVVVFTWSFSPFSQKGRALLDSLGARYTAIDLDKTPGGMALKKELYKRTGRSSVPSVFIRGEHIGGCFDGPGLVPLYQSGDLQKMLKRARAL